MPEFKDYYKILQVDPSADPEIIAVAYKRLALKYHPDTNGSPDAGRMMQDINEAYRVLSDPDARARYDQERAWHVRAGTSTHQGYGAQPGPRQHGTAGGDGHSNANPNGPAGSRDGAELDPDSVAWRSLQRDQPTGRPYWPQWGISPTLLLAIVCIAVSLGFLLLSALTGFRGFLFIFVSPSLIALAIDLLRRRR
jgi:curved DNA-binding protein CbpA